MIRVTDLVEFLTAQYDEDEKTARAAGGGRASGRRWDAVQAADCRARGAIGDGHGDIVVYECYAGADHANHIARHDPARVLADIAAKRRRLERHTPGDGAFCGACEQEWPCEDVRIDASVYADRPGYKPQWAVDA